MQVRSPMFQGKVVLVTGAGGGFGEALARHFVVHGASLVLTSRQPEKLQRTAEAVAGVGPGRVLGTVVADLATDAGCESVFVACAGLAPHVDVLIHNAGLGLYGPFHAVPQPAWEQLVQVNLLAPLRLTTRFLPQMLDRRSGHVVLIGSILGLRSLPGMSVYALTKFGLRGFGEALLEDVVRFGLDVSVVYPSFTQTEMLHAAPQYGDTRSYVPGWLVDDTDAVIAQIVAGVARRRRHIYPSARAFAFALASRFAPWVLPPLARWVTS